MARRGTQNVTLRLDRELWDRLGIVVPDRSALLRAVVRWYIREPDAVLPRRPAAGSQDDAA
jgi:hypothetical protein